MTKMYQEDKYLLQNEVSLWSKSDNDKGQVYTCSKVVDFMITSIGLNNESFENIKVLEPSCGEGEFVIPIIEYFIKRTKHKVSVKELLGKLLAIDIVQNSIEITKVKVRKLLITNGYVESEINILLQNWFLTGDFLLQDIESKFTHVIGNPPYVRLENIPRLLLTEYRKRYDTMTHRADLYIPFFEKSLSLLSDKGKLSFICTDRWTKNTYGKSLRKLISNNYSLELFIDLYGFQAFKQDVMTYPAITQIGKHKKSNTILLQASSINNKIAMRIANKPDSFKTRKNIVNDANPWLIDSIEKIKLIQKLESQYQTLEEADCNIFIGAATGANKVYIVDKNIDIESSRKIPVITASELKSGDIKWKEKYLINTYNDNKIIDLYDYPKLNGYLNLHREQLSSRHIAKKDSKKWFKTIDKVHEERLRLKKLLIPDISNYPIVIYDKGEFYPNNSIYYICSDSWNLHALKVVLLSNVTKLFISSYSTKIANGYLRFQAQHLRKLRIPSWNSIDKQLRNQMIEAGLSNDVEIFSSLTYEMYQLTQKEKLIIGK